MAELRLEGVSKTFPSGEVAVQDVSLTVADGELLVLIGPSGCGKSTILRMISGLETLTRGAIFLGDRPIDNLSESARDIAMIFQNYALYPHLSVHGNIAFPLRVKRVPKPERDRRVREVAETLGLTPQLNSKPGQLSGGQRQRVAMGRAIIRHPQLFLMDEPLSNLDAKLRAEMRGELSAIQRRLGITTVYVTHDQAEAMTLGDHVAVLNKGSLLQLGTPEEIYARPNDLFVAGCLGSPAINTFAARLASSSAGVQVVFEGQLLQLDEAEIDRHRVGAEAGRDVVVGIRPEAMLPASAETAALSSRLLHGNVVSRESLGSELLVTVDLRTPAQAAAAHDSLLSASVPMPDSVSVRSDHRVVARLPADSPVSEGEQIGLVVARNGLHLFDPATGVTWAKRTTAVSTGATAVPSTS